MSHQSVRILIRDVALTIADNINFVYARLTDFNQIRNKQYPFFQLEPLKSQANFNASNVTLTRTYPIVVNIYKLDAMDGTEDETTQILDETDVLCDQFIRLMNKISMNEDTTIKVSTDTIVLSGIRFDPFIKTFTADVTSGFKVSFNMEVPDDFDYCSIYG